MLKLRNLLRYRLSPGPSDSLVDVMSGTMVLTGHKLDNKVITPTIYMLAVQNLMQYLPLDVCAFASFISFHNREFHSGVLGPVNAAFFERSHCLVRFLSIQGDRTPVSCV